MTESQVAQPKIVSQDEWRAARKELLAREKDLTRQKDALNAERRRLPMVPVSKSYSFEGPEGKVSLTDLFGDSRQLIIYHFMFAPEWEEGCMGCTGFVDSLGDLSLLKERDTAFALISRAPLAKLEAYRTKRGWDRPWYSSYGSDFNYDFHVTSDARVAPPEYNYRSQEEWHEKDGNNDALSGEHHGLSVFFRTDDGVCHTYSSYGRGVESLTDAYSLLDVTPYGRQEDFEDSPSGWPQKPTYG